MMDFITAPWRSKSDAPSPKVPGNAAELARERSRHEWYLFLGVLVAALVITPAFILGGLSSIGFKAMIGLVVVLAILIAVAARPVLALYIVALCVVLIEQEPLQFRILTDNLYVYYWPPKLAGLIERPIGFLFLYAFLVILVRNLATRRPLLQGGKLLGTLLLLVGAVSWGVLHGLQAGGDFKLMVLEVRPFQYLFYGYILAYNLVTTKRQIITFIWIVIVGAGIKAMQAMYIVFKVLHGHRDGYNEIMAHEDSFFWVALMLLAVLFLIQYRQRLQMRWAWIITPFAVLAIYYNNRRADYVAFLIGAVVAWIIVIVAKRSGRLKHIVAFASIAGVSGAYMLIFSHVSGKLGGPARAIISVVSPSSTDLRDILSNQYRTYENADLLFTFHQNPIFGWGYGHNFLQPFLLPNILSLDPVYLLVPHNTILWVLMSLGLIGFAALWNFFGQVIIRGCEYAREIRDPYLQLVAIYIVSVTIMEVIVAYADYQLFFYRNMIYMGLLAAILVRLPLIDAAQTKREREEQERKEREEREEQERIARQQQHVTVRLTGSPATIKVEGVMLQ